MSELLTNKKKMLKELIKKLHSGTSLDELKDKFKEVLEVTGPDDIARIEEELIKESIAREEIQKLCDVHLAVFRESLEKKQTFAPQGHPIRTLMEEHKMLLQFAENLKNTVGKIKSANDFDAISNEMEHLIISQSILRIQKNTIYEKKMFCPLILKNMSFTEDGPPIKIICNFVEYWNKNKS